MDFVPSHPQPVPSRTLSFPVPYKKPFRPAEAQLAVSPRSRDSSLGRCPVAPTATLQKAYESSSLGPP